MKIFVDIPKSPNMAYKVSAIKAIRNLSDPPLPLPIAKKITETPGWHHIYNDKVRGLGPYMQLLDQELTQSSVSAYDCLKALRDYRAGLMLYADDEQPEGYVDPDDRPTPEQPTLRDLLYRADPTLAPKPKPLPPTPNDLLDSLTPALTKALEIRDYTMLRIIAGVAEDIIEKYNL